MALPKNQFFVIVEKSREPGQHLYISDANFNIKEIKNPTKPLLLNLEFTFCFYDDSIFMFKDCFDMSEGLNVVPDARRYIISQNKWINLNVQYCGYPYSCVGFKDKIIFAGWMSGIWIYDILLDSYSQHLIRNFDTEENKMLLKISGKIYLLVPYLSKILYCDDPLLDWMLLSNFHDTLFCERASPHVYYHGSIYYFRRDLNSTLYEFSLSKFSSKPTKLKGSTNNAIKI
ncbi:unnamed protein product [Blepharisma stoltei]|uniref:DUF295 domain-containing protein n=1 Tax=Blepharisma stoltei TaxID=1481888 RepID=A0AAU9IFX3_9CILI|nr:unnamed protein product [Blepharisma stoltei]